VPTGYHIEKPNSSVKWVSTRVQFTELTEIMNVCGGLSSG
jgi:hypothetical protein